MADPRLRFYTLEHLGATQSLTPEGFLLCVSVPIARTGTLTYGADELPALQPNKDGLIFVSRDPDDVFTDESIASFAGKPVTDDHPSERVDPSNWRQHSVGVTLNPRRGDGALFDSNFLYADLLIQDPNAIKAVRDGKREVSAGYDADYHQLAPGKGRQFNVVGNHVALVDRGRCGPRCAIGDHAMVTRPAVVRRKTPGNNRGVSFRDKVLAKFYAGDADGLVDELDKVEGMMGEQISGDALNPDQTNSWTGEEEATGRNAPVIVNVSTNGSAPGAPEAPSAPVVGMMKPNEDDAVAAPAAGGGDAVQQAVAAALGPLMQRLDTLEQAVAAMLKGDGDDSGDDDTSTPTEDKARQTGDAASGSGGETHRARVGDSTSMQTAFTDMLAKAEILNPGGQGFPTFDAAIGARDTFTTMCNFRKKTLSEAYSRDAKVVIDRILAGERADFNGMTCDAAGLLFNAAADAAATRNNSRFASGARGPEARKFAGSAPTPAQINEANRKKYGIAR
jgi:hypothetical protein